MVNFQYKSHYDLQDLLEVMRVLRGPGGCPWDREQTHESIRRNLLEEAYEAADAIDSADLSALQEELGDVLMQVVFHAQIETEKGGFTLDDVADGVCKKLIYRHPHVFGTVQAEDSDTVLTNWEVLKRAEKGQASTADALDAVAHLPALWRAEKIQNKAAKAGFDWPSPMGAVDKLSEETEELRRAVAKGDAQGPHGIREEVGDVLFTAVKVARDAGVDPEEALHAACDKFNQRFRKVEQSADKPLSEMKPEELAGLWRAAKKES